MAGKTVIPISPPHPNTPPHTTSVIQTTLGPLNISGATLGSVWTSNAYGPAAPPKHSICPGAWWGSMRFGADKQFRGTSIVFVPGTTAGVPGSDGSNMMAPSQYGQAVLHSLDWEVFVTPPSSDIEDLACADVHDMANRPLWETLAGFFLSGVWDIELGQVKYMQSPLSSGLQGVSPLSPASQFLRARCEFPQPLNAPRGTTTQINVRFDKSWRPIVPVTIRCSINFTLASSF